MTWHKVRRNCSFFSCKDVDMVAKRGGTNILAQAAPHLFPFLHFQQSPPPLPRHDFYDYKVLMKKHKYQIEKRFKLQKYIVASRNTCRSSQTTGKRTILSQALWIGNRGTCYKWYSLNIVIKWWLLSWKTCICWNWYVLIRNGNLVFKKNIC